MFQFLTDLLKRLARAPGFEPGIADPKSAALPLGHARKSCERDWKGWGIPVYDLHLLSSPVSHAFMVHETGRFVNSPQSLHSAHTGSFPYL